jgi:hypothetical protein
MCAAPAGDVTALPSECFDVATLAARHPSRPRQLLRCQVLLLGTRTEPNENSWVTVQKSTLIIILPSDLQTNTSILFSSFSFSILTTSTTPTTTSHYSTPEG